MVTGRTNKYVDNAFKKVALKVLSISVILMSAIHQMHGTGTA